VRGRGRQGREGGSEGGRETWKSSAEASELGLATPGEPKPSLASGMNEGRATLPPACAHPPPRSSTQPRVVAWVLRGEQLPGREAYAPPAAARTRCTAGSQATPSLGCRYTPSAAHTTHTQLTQINVRSCVLSDIAYTTNERVLPPLEREAAQYLKVVRVTEGRVRVVVVEVDGGGVILHINTPYLRQYISCRGQGHPSCRSVHSESRMRGRCRR
jgi:hypothetical protein